jgi:rRNA maturation endonuclease Nob1
MPKVKEPESKFTKEYGKGDGENLTPADYKDIAATVIVQGETVSPESPEVSK